MWSLKNKKTNKLVNFSLSTLENHFHSQTLLLGENENFPWVVVNKLEAEAMLNLPSLTSKTLWACDFFPEDWKVVKLTFAKK
jgi:hypothetical protein